MTLISWLVDFFSCRTNENRGGHDSTKNNEDVIHLSPKSRQSSRRSVSNSLSRQEERLEMPRDYSVREGSRNSRSRGSRGRRTKIQESERASQSSYQRRANFFYNEEDQSYPSTSKYQNHSMNKAYLDDFEDSEHYEERLLTGSEPMPNSRYHFGDNLLLKRGGTSSSLHENYVMTDRFAPYSNQQKNSRGIRHIPKFIYVPFDLLDHDSYSSYASASSIMSDKSVFFNSDVITSPYSRSFDTKHAQWHLGRPRSRSWDENMTPFYYSTNKVRYSNFRDFDESLAPVMKADRNMHYKRHKVTERMDQDMRFLEKDATPSSNLQRKSRPSISNLFNRRKRINHPNGRVAVITAKAPKTHKLRKEVRGTSPSPQRMVKQYNEFYKDQRYGLRKPTALLSDSYDAGHPVLYGSPQRKNYNVCT